MYAIRSYYEYYQNEMLITTKEPKEDVFNYLETKNIENKITLNGHGIICETDGKQPAQAVLEEVINGGFTVQEFKRLNATLEDVFIRITSYNVCYTKLLRFIQSFTH